MDAYNAFNRKSENDVPINTLEDQLEDSLWDFYMGFYGRAEQTIYRIARIVTHQHNEKRSRENAKKEKSGRKEEKQKDFFN